MHAIKIETLILLIFHLLGEETRTFRRKFSLDHSSVIKLSNVPLSNHEKSVLSKRLTFCAFVLVDSRIHTTNISESHLRKTESSDHTF